jgi:gas vesicle protein
MDEINEKILLAVFLLGALVGAVIVSIVDIFQVNKRGKNER